MQNEDPGVIFGLTLIAIALVLFFLPAYLFPGGFSFQRAGIAIVDRNGRQASRWRCVARSFVSWCVMGTIVIIIYASSSLATTFSATHLSFLGLAGVLFVLYILECIRNPNRAPHDYISRTYLVPS